MSRVNDFQPNWASAPGDTIAEILRNKNLTLDAFAQRMNASSDYVAKLLEGYIEITDGIAAQLAQTLGASYEFWVKRESQYRENIARLIVEEEQTWLRELPIRDMVKFGWLTETQDMLQQCLTYFNVPDIKTWKKDYSGVISSVAFRTSSSFRSETNAVLAWLRQGEIQGKALECDIWNEDNFANSLLDIRKLTRKKNPQEFIPELIKICAASGVAVVIVRTPAGCRASGATRFLSSKRGLIQLSFRYLSDDQFWFTFFHEAGHLLLHGDKSIFLEDIGSQNFNTEEDEANKFAGEVLIPYTLEPLLAKIKGNKRNIINFALEAGISPGIVVGQLQHRGYIAKSGQTDPLHSEQTDPTLFGAN